MTFLFDHLIRGDQQASRSGKSRAFAVLRLRAASYFVGVCTGYIDITPSWVDATFVDRYKAIARESTLAATVSSGTTISVSGTPPIIGDGS